MQQHLRKLPPPPIAGEPPHGSSSTGCLDTAPQLCTTDGLCWLNFPTKASSGASLSCVSPLEVYFWKKKKPWKSYLHKYHNFYCSVHSFWRNIPKLHSYSLSRICAFFQFEFAWLLLPVSDSCCVALFKIRELQCSVFSPREDTCAL